MCTLPLEGSFDLPRLYENPELVPDFRDFVCLVEGQLVKIKLPQIGSSINYCNFQPVLRGARRSDGEPDHIDLVQEVHQDGLAEIVFSFVPPGSASEPLHLHLSWSLGLLANLLNTADSLRVTAGRPNAEFALDVWVFGALKNPIVAGLTNQQKMDVDTEDGSLEENPLSLPQYRFRAKEEFPIVIRDVMNHLREAAGLRAVTDFNMDSSQW
jgi:hypothetical protein